MTKQPATQAEIRALRDNVLGLMCTLPAGPLLAWQMKKLSRIDSYLTSLLKAKMGATR